VGLLDELFGSGLAGLWGAAQRYLPPCSVCGEVAVFRCLECGEFVCHKHTFVSPEPLQAVCRPCVAKRFPWAKRPERQGLEQWPYAESPWDVLGVAAGADVVTVKTAYRQLSKQCHPDHGGSPEAQSKLNAAYAIMMARAAERAA